MNIVKKSYNAVPYMGSQYSSPYSAQGGNNMVRGGQINTFQGLLAALMARGMKMPDVQESTGGGGQEQITDFLDYFMKNSGQGDGQNEFSWDALKKAQKAYAVNSAAQEAKQGVIEGAKGLGDKVVQGAPGVIEGAKGALNSGLVQNVQEDVGKGVTGALNSGVVQNAQEDIGKGFSSLKNSLLNYAKPRR